MCEKESRKEVPWGGFNGQEGRGKAHRGQQQSSPPSVSPSYRHIPALGHGLRLWPVTLMQLWASLVRKGYFGKKQALPLSVSAKSFFIYKHVLLLFSDRL